MVRLLLMLMFPFVLLGQDVDVKAEISRSHIYEHYPVTGTIIITHSKDETIDTDSFTYEGKPLKVELEKEVRIDPEAPLMISLYRFTLSAQTAGEHTLNPIKVKVGGKEYQSFPVPYMVFKADVPLNVEEPLLKLEAVVDAEEPLYPGQRIKLIYRYTYKGNIQMTKEDLPMLNPKGFKQIGEEHVKDFDKGDRSIREITLEVEATEPGEFTFGPSTIEGQATVPGRPPIELRSEVPSITITVAPFPHGEKPVTFEGAYGTFTIEDSLLSPDSVKVGDRLTLAVDITGDPKQLAKVELPDLFCQPGFPGMFISDDLPVIGKIEEDRKRFTVYLRPNNDAVTEIPPIELNYYNPSTKKYEKSISKAIPIEVAPVKNVLSETMEKIVLPQQSAKQENWKVLLRRMSKVEIAELTYVSSADLNNLPFGGWYVLLIIPAGAGILVGQIYLKRYFERLQGLKRRITAKELLAQAREERDNPPRFFDLLTQSLTTLLWERGEIESPTLAPEKLPEGEVRDLLCEIQKKRFGEQEPLQPREVWGQAKELFGKCGGEEQ